MQAVDTVAPESELYVPGLHAVHNSDVAAPARLPYAPATQAVQAAASALSELYAPAAHDVQAPAK